MHTRILFAVLIILAFESQAQVRQVRFEMPLHDGQVDPYRTTSLQENGLLLYGHFLADGANAIEVIRLDTAFNEIWRGFIKIDRGMFMVFSFYANSNIYMLLKDRYNPLAEFQLLAVQVSKGNYTMNSVKTMIPFIPTNFVVTKQAALIGGHFNYRPLVLHYDLATYQSKVLPGFFNEQGDLNQLNADENGNIDVLVSGKTINRRRSLWLRRYDANGDLLKTIVLQPEDNMNLIYGRSVNTADGSQIVCGVYGRYTEYSRGIFLANVNAYGEYDINYYNFADLQKFFSYMKAKRERRVRDRIERRKVQGKKNRFNYRVLVNELMPYGDQFVMLGEAFYPHYSYPQTGRNYGGYTYFPRYGYIPSTRGDLIFDGYQYTHAVVIGFDNTGKLTWDNSFEINDVRTMQLQQYVKIRPDKDKISLMYLFDNKIRSKIIKEAEVLEGKSYDPLSMAFRDDVVKERGTQGTKLDYWYGDVFYATGIQNISNLRDAGVNLSRRVFFINKIECK